MMGILLQKGYELDDSKGWVGFMRKVFSKNANNRGFLIDKKALIT